MSVNDLVRMAAKCLTSDQTKEVLQTAKVVGIVKEEPNEEVKTSPEVRERNCTTKDQKIDELDSTLTNDNISELPTDIVIKKEGE